MSKFKEGDKCRICGREWAAKKRFINHHVSYDPEIIAIVCQPCHNWMHGTRAIYKHPFKEKYDRARAVWKFAECVLDAHDEAWLKYRAGIGCKGFHDVDEFYKD